MALFSRTSSKVIKSAILQPKFRVKRFSKSILYVGVFLFVGGLVYFASYAFRNSHFVSQFAKAPLAYAAVTK